MQLSGIVEGREIVQQNWGMRAEAPLLDRFLGKLVLDILPAALASVIGGFLFTQYQSGRAVALHAATEQVTPASAEMMAMVRDEHAMMMDYLKSQMAAEKSRATVADADTARAAADAKAEVAKAEVAKAEVAKAEITKADETRVAMEAAARRMAAAALAPKPLATHSKPPAAVVATAHAPLVIAQADQNQAAQNMEQRDGAAPTDRIARDPDSLLAKTLDLKDHVVAATRHVVSALGDMFASLGDHIGGAASPRQFSSDS